MDTHAWIALAIMLVAATLFFTRRVPIEATALSIPLALWLTGTVRDPKLVLAGFGNQAVILLASVFVLGAAMHSSGVADILARRLRWAGRNETLLVLMVGLVVALLSAFMSNAATVALMLPGVVALGRASGVSPSRLLMPTAFAALLGGNLTLIGTSSNLLLSNQSQAMGGAPIGMFDFALVGLPIAVLGVLFMALLGRRMLPANQEGDRLSRGGLPAQLASEYGLAANLTRLRVGGASLLAGKPLSALQLARNYDVVVVLVGRHEGLGLQWHVPTSDLIIRQGDDLYMEGATEDLWRLAEEQRTRIGLAGQHQVEAVIDQGIRLAEVLVGPRSGAIGKTLREAGIRRQFKLSVLTLWRGEQKLARGLSSTPLEMGDTLLVAGSERALRRLGENDDFVLLGHDFSGLDLRKARLTMGWLAVALLPPALGWAPAALSAMLAALLALLSGCVSRRDAARSMEWRVLALIVGTLPLGYALKFHGVADEAARLVALAASGAGTPGVLGALFGVATLVSITASNAAAAVILAPVAMATAANLGLPPQTCLLAVAYGCSCAFAQPFNQQCNLLVAAPGGYSPRHFMRVGALLSLLVGALAVSLLSLSVA